MGNFPDYGQTEGQPQTNGLCDQIDTDNQVLCTLKIISKKINCMHSHHIRDTYQQEFLILLVHNEKPLTVS